MTARPDPVPEPGAALHYPYGPDPLLPAWGSVKARALVILAVLGAVSGCWLGSALGRPVNELALLAVLPGILAFTLAVAPEPATRLGTIAGGFALDAGISLRRRRAAGFSRPVFACPETGIRVRGIAALTRALERRSLPWALLGWAMRTPLVLEILQGIAHLAILGATLRRGRRLVPHRLGTHAG
ncbi:PEP-CTERM sorting domain-containing protein [Methylobacterium durans]|uniref:PEP-CTERM sorting domain-containing protein n=1 Tax=Methylobacterium durans TaxID=2202825 RepID=UPI002AFF56D0|nr:PEP-CTERM sorting domain-containing protein [Methylobacterium durans]MEA1834313.1 PEP-CTERM sorting domain-containing protein [Methylobacterium durans]